MKSLTVFFSWIIFCSSLFANPQEIEGKWNGLLETQGIKLRLVFNIEKTIEGYTATLDSPDQGAKGIDASKVSFENEKLFIEVAIAGLTYEGILEGGELKGKLVQFGMELPLNFSREEIELPKLVRPQEPFPPFPYKSEDVKFFNEQAEIFLDGTFTHPFEGENLPAVIFVTGSGPQNRDEEILGHKPFLVISDYLARNGIAALRFDDRGVGESEGDFNTATSVDFTTDVSAAVKFLMNRPEIDPSKIGIVGHSEGGMIAAMVAAQHPESVAFVISLAGTGVRGDQIVLAQQQLIGKAEGIGEEELLEASKINERLFNAVIEIEDDEVLKNEISAIMSQAISDGIADVPEGMDFDYFLNMQVAQITSPWMLFFLSYDPSKAWQRVKSPVLALNGENDLQVPAEINLNAIRDSMLMGGNTDVTTVELKGLNHLFQECEIGSPSLYGTIEQTFSTEALEVMKKWIRERFVD